MQKTPIILAVAVSILIIIAVVIQPSKEPVSFEIRALSDSRNPSQTTTVVDQDVLNLNSKSNTPVKTERADDGRLIVKGALPPELKKLKGELDVYTQEIQNTPEPIESILNDGRDTDKIIAEMDSLVETTNKRLGIDGDKVVSLLTADIPIQPELKQVNTQFEKAEEEIIELERMFE